MSALYRKYRPNQFTGLVGQDHIRDNLRNALKKNAIGHAYLFSGPRGTGKTSTARLFAKAINCLRPVDGVEPCGKCEMCLQISNGQAVDIIEIDAASNRGIDEIRDLRDKIAFAPTQAKYKVYIIDEVHMLTKEAFNALLKTLEEPPAHAVFILATTELHKVPETIISRCQRFQFHLASKEALFELLKDIIKKEKIALDDEALGLVVNRAEGSFRDALTLLGNVASHDGKITAKELREIMGLPPGELIETVKRCLEQRSDEELMIAVRGFLADGGDLLVLVKQVTDLLKQEILSGGASNQLAAARLLERLMRSLSRARFVTDPAALVLAELYTLAGEGQAAVAAPAAVAPVVEQIKSEPAVPVTIKDLHQPEAEVVAPKEEAVAVDAVTAPAKPKNADEFWSNFLLAVKEANHALYAVIRSAELENLLEDKVIIAVKFRFYSERLYESKNRKIIQDAASKVAGRELALECHVRKDIKQAPEVKAEEDLVGAVVDVFEITEEA